MPFLVVVMFVKVILRRFETLASPTVQRNQNHCV